MAKKKWTREERKKHVMSSYPEVKAKIFAVLIVIAIFIILISILSIAFQSQVDPFLLALLVIAVVVMIPIAVFLIDMAFESWT